MSSVSSLSSSSRKRKREWKEVVVVGEQIVSAAAGGIAGHTISAVLGGYGELKSVDEQLEHLEWMVTEIDSTVADAARVPTTIRSCSLRQWLWNLQEAACEGKAVARGGGGGRRKVWQRAVGRRQAHLPLRQAGSDGGRGHGQAGAARCGSWSEHPRARAGS
ncbi:unnamed protein product [Urochloa humidicola]